ncbi:hypothetical protein F6455_00425 [Proteobacteria bacterium 005FR1]|nr:hypothetical protein [Proteobacteria bacterium 005FR1]
MKFRHLVLSIAVVFSPAVVFAADGNLGASSQADTTITLEVPKLVQVSLASHSINIPFTTSGGTGASTGVCIYSKETSNVDVTVTTLNGSFAMENGVGNNIPYSVALSNSGGSLGTFAYNTPLAVADANTTSTTCGSAFPHTLDLDVAQAGIDAAPSGTYQDTVYITVAAQ